jgi:hypothetical protein
MRERAFCFGSEQGLVGVLCEPDTRRAGAPAALFSNVGLNHRVGPNRTWVETARRLAELGLVSLRFDLSGVGDSEARRDTRSDLERAVLDTREALDFVNAKCGIDRFLLIANCSGVDSQHATALQEPRVVGAVAIDGYVYRNRGYALRRGLMRFFQPARWARRWRWRRLTSQARARGLAAGAQEVWKRDIPSPERFASDLAQLVRRRMKLLFIYTSGVDTHYNYRGQFHDMFGFRREAPVVFLPRADHLFSRESDRRELYAGICAWIEREFPPSA